MFDTASIYLERTPERVQQNNHQRPTTPRPQTPASRLAWLRKQGNPIEIVTRKTRMANHMKHGRKVHVMEGDEIHRHCYVAPVDFGRSYIVILTMNAAQTTKTAKTVRAAYKLAYAAVKAQSW